MKFHFFTFGTRSVASSRVRAFWIADALNELGHQAQVTVVSEYSVRAFFKYFSALWSSRNDVIYLQRTIYNKYFFTAVLLARILGVKFIFDFDDPVFVHSRYKTILMTKLARLTVCGSEFIAQWAREFSNKVLVLEDGLPLSIYTDRGIETSHSCIGWIGNGRVHLENLKLLVPVFRRLKEMDVAFKFRLIGAVHDERIHNLFAEFDAEVIDVLDWSDPSNAVREIHTFTIGIMPLVQDTWGNAKYFKLLEYMACGVPVLASEADTVSHLIDASQAGLTAKTEDDWVKQLARMLSNTTERESFGTNGRRFVENSYSTRALAQNLVDYVRAASLRAPATAARKAGMSEL